MVIMCHWHVLPTRMVCRSSWVSWFCACVFQELSQEHVIWWTYFFLLCFSLRMTQILMWPAKPMHYIHGIILHHSSWMHCWGMYLLGWHHLQSYMISYRPFDIGKYHWYTHGYHCLHPYPQWVHTCGHVYRSERGYPIFIPVHISTMCLYLLSPHWMRVREKVRVQEVTVERAQLYVHILLLLLYPLTGRAILSLGKGVRGWEPRTCESEGHVMLSELLLQD